MAFLNSKGIMLKVSISLFVFFSFMIHIVGQDIYKIVNDATIAEGPSYAVGVGEDVIAYGDGAILKIFQKHDDEVPVLVNSTELHSNIDDIQIVGDLLYLVGDEVGLTVYDISDPSTPEMYTSFEIDEYDFQFAVVGSFVYISDGYGMLHVVDLTDPMNPAEVQEIYIENRARELVLQEDRLVLVAYNRTIILDVSNPGEPIELVNFESKDFSDAELMGNNLYLTDNDTLHIYDISDVSNPQLISQFGTTTSSMVKIEIMDDHLFAVGGSGRYTIYEMLEDNEFNFVGGVDQGGYYLDLKLSDQFAYVIGVRKGLIVFDNSIMTDPATYFTNENGSFVYGVDIVDNICYIANELDGLQIYTINSENNFEKAGGIDFGFQGAYQVEVAGNYAYVARRIEGLSIVDVSDIYNPIEVSSMELTGRTYDVVYRDGLLYVAQRKEGLLVLDASDPTNPVEIGFIPLEGNMVNIEVKGNYAYTANGNEGMFIIDISDPTDPQLVSNYNDAIIPDHYVKSAEDVVVVGDIAYLADYSNGFHVIDVSDKYNPVSLSNEIDYGLSKGIHFRDGIIYLARGLEGFSIFDVNDVNNIRELAMYNTGGHVNDFALSDDYILINDLNCGFSLFHLEITTSIDDQELSGQRFVNVYPNPAVSYLTIEFDPIGIDYATIYLIDSKGKTIDKLFEGKLNEGVQTIHYSNEFAKEWSTGMYMVKIVTENRIHTVPLVIQRNK